jgi:hypothetical protein
VVVIAVGAAAVGVGFVAGIAALATWRNAGLPAGDGVATLSKLPDYSN